MDGKQVSDPDPDSKTGDQHCPRKQQGARMAEAGDLHEVAE